MGRMPLIPAECKYNEIDRQLKEQFNNGLNDDNMIIEIIKEMTVMNNMT